MISKTSRTLPWMMLLALVLMPIDSSFAASRISTSGLTAKSAKLSTKIAQADADLQRRLQEQREVERVLKEGERLKREVRDNNDHGLERQVGEQIIKVRESGRTPQQVREADAELNRLRQQNNRHNYYYDRYYYPYYNTAPIIFAPGFYRNEPDYRTPINTYPSTDPAPSRPSSQIGQNDTTSDANSSNVSLLVSSGFKDGKIAPGIGVKYNSIGFEIAGIFNQDSFPGTLNDFSLPGDLLSNNLGVKKLSPQWGADVLGFLDLDPRTSVYGSVGLYFQSIGRIAQSQANLNEFYKQTNDTETTGAIGGGVTYKASGKIDLGIGYHSLRGLTARIGISF
jgi:opacity protein-like surface antigen